MTSDAVFLRGPSYVLGEQELDHTAIGNLGELADRFRLTRSPALWGWGTIRATGRDLAELAADTGRATLAAAGLAAGGIDALLLCCTRIPGPAEEHGQFMASVLTGIGLPDLPFYGMNLNRCVNLLAGLDVARALVTGGRYRRVLVITTDKVAAGADRMSPFALYSDGAASCVVAADPGEGDGYQLLGCATAQQTATMDQAAQISSDLAREVNDRLLGEHGLKPGDLSCLMHANLFTPLVVMKELQAGFTAQQLYTGNIARIGHCFAADPLINLVDRAALGHVEDGGYCLLASTVPGSRIAALLRRNR